MLENVYEGVNARSEVYLSKEYFYEMYPTCVSLKRVFWTGIYSWWQYYDFSEDRNENALSDDDNVYNGVDSMTILMTSTKILMLCREANDHWREET